MAEPTYLDNVKVALRISHSKLDDEITATISAAKKELERAGLLDTAVVESDVLISDAIKTYCKYVFSSDLKMREGYFASWQYQIDCLRKSSNYMGDLNV